VSFLSLGRLLQLQGRDCICAGDMGRNCWSFSRENHMATVGAGAGLGGTGKRCPLARSSGQCFAETKALETMISKALSSPQESTRKIQVPQSADPHIFLRVETQQRMANKNSKIGCNRSAYHACSRRPPKAVFSPSSRSFNRSAELSSAVLSICSSWSRT